ncbi:hypothetical protein DdX_05703 [Ditylenchus destructor]|uniref:Uncharacterized protein n=1 Tax=Ditylenchus destructor TaxID=166010 RepID=A0AAD4N7Q5_9BILA|nr:hypothetical protein DdX_05703 [Ditylenchus destructor]
MNAGRLDKLIERFLRKNSADSEQDSLRKAEENDFGKNSTNNSIARNRRFRRPPLRRTPENEPDEASSSINTDRVNQRYSSEEIDEQINEIDPNFPSTSTTFAQVFPQISNATDIINKDENNRSKAGVPDETGNQPGLLTPSSSDRSADNPMTQHAPFVASNRDFSSNAVTSTTATLNSSIVSPSVMTSGSSTHQDLSALNRVDSSRIPATRKFDLGVYNFGNREIGQNQPHPRVPNNPVKMELNSPDGSGCKSISSAYAYAAAANFAEFLSSNSGLSSAAAAVAASTNSPYSLMQHPISSINLRISISLSGLFSWKQLSQSIPTPNYMLYSIPTPHCIQMWSPVDFIVLSPFLSILGISSVFPILNPHPLSINTWSFLQQYKESPQRCAVRQNTPCVGSKSLISAYRIDWKEIFNKLSLYCGQPALVSHGYCIAANWSLVEMGRIDGDPQTVLDSLDN